MMSEEEIPDEHRSPVLSGRVVVPVMLVAALVITAAAIYVFLQNKHAFDPRTRCRGNLEAIGRALKAYDQQFGCLPPAYVLNDDGDRMHSWRVLILPFLKEEEVEDLSELYRIDEPWNSEFNRRFNNDYMPLAYYCPQKGRSLDVPSSTSFVAVVGDDTAWPGDKPRSLKDLDHKILVVEYAGDDLTWTEPRDLSFDKMEFRLTKQAKGGMGSKYDSGPLVLYADGTVEELDPNIPPEELRNQFLVEDAKK